MSISWGARRRLIYISAILLVLLAVAARIVYPYVTKPASCTDGKMNGTETGTDCGGQCANFCKEEVSPLVVQWARVFQVSGSLYNAVAYVENQNANAAIPNISYEFKVYDGNNILITTRVGQTFIAPNGRTAIFESGLSMGNRVPRRTSFAFTSAQNFYKVDQRFSDFKVFAKDATVGDEDTFPKAQGVIENSSIYPVGELDVIAILYDEFGNALGVSKTISEALPPQSSKQVFFSWLTPFGSSVRRVELIPRINPYTQKYQ